MPFAAKQIWLFNCNFISRLLHWVLMDCIATTDEMVRFDRRLDALQVAFHVSFVFTIPHYFDKGHRSSESTQNV